MIERAILVLLILTITWLGLVIFNLRAVRKELRRKQLQEYRENTPEIQELKDQLDREMKKWE